MSGRAGGRDLCRSPPTYTSAKFPLASNGRPHIYPSHLEVKHAQCRPADFRRNGTQGITAAVRSVRRATTVYRLKRGSTAGVVDAASNRTPVIRAAEGSPGPRADHGPSGTTQCQRLRQSSPHGETAFPSARRSSTDDPLGPQVLIAARPGTTPNRRRRGPPGGVDRQARGRCTGEHRLPWLHLGFLAYGRDH